MVLGDPITNKISTYFQKTIYFKYIFQTICFNHFYHCQELNDKTNDKNNLCYVAIKMLNMQRKWIPKEKGNIKIK